MKALSLTAPYGTLISIAERHPALGKHIETRSWATKYRGQLAIHQAKGLGPIGGRAGLYDLAFSDPDGYFYSALCQVNVRRIENLPLGAIVAVCDLIDCRKIPVHMPVAWGYLSPDQGHEWQLTDQERAFGDYTAGRFAWLLANIRALPEPVLCKGALSLWQPDTLTEMAVTRQLIGGVKG